MSFIKVTCTAPGRRRAGRVHEAVKIWPAGTFTSEQLAVLRADPSFTLETVSTDEAALTAGAAPVSLPAVPTGIVLGRSGLFDDWHRWLVVEATAVVLRAIALGDDGKQFAADMRGIYEIYREGRSGTAREASSAGSGPDVAGAAAASGGVQPAAPQQPEPADLLTLHGSGASVGSTNTEGAPTPPPADAGPSTDSSMQAGTGDALDNAASLATEIVGSQGVPSASEESVEESGEASEAVASEPTPAPTKKSRATKSTR